MKPTAPGSLFIIFAFVIYFYLLLFSDLLNQKYKNTLLHFILFAIYLFQSLTTFSRQHGISGAVPRKGLTTPLTHRVARCCCLCAGVAYVVLLGSPTGSITLVPFLSEIPTAAVLHQYLKRTKDMFLVYGGDKELVVNGYVDASFDTDPNDSKSQTGYIFVLNGGAISWCSSK